MSVEISVVVAIMAGYWDQSYVGLFDTLLFDVFHCLYCNDSFNNNSSIPQFLCGIFSAQILHCLVSLLASMHFKLFCIQCIHKICYLKGKCTFISFLWSVL